VSFSSTWGLWRSLAMYYGQPWKTGRMNRFYGQFVQPGDLCFDVGAHVGNRVRSWLGLGGTVVAIEPQPRMRQILERWYGRNDQVHIEAVGLSDQPGELTLHINTRNPTLTTFSKNWISDIEGETALPAAPWDDVVQVEVRTMDQLIETHGMPVFCKIDVEGFEDKVLAGLSSPVRALSFEAFPLDKERSIRCVRRLMELGDYRFRTVRAESFRWVEEDWVTLEDIEASILAQTLEDGSGDIYARLYTQS